MGVSVNKIVLGVIFLLGGASGIYLYRRSLDPLVQVQSLFEQYVEYQEKHDPRLADLFEDSAVIKATLLDGTPNGKAVQLKGDRYKELIRNMRGAKDKRAATSSYSDVTYVPDGDTFKITAARSTDDNIKITPFLMIVRRDQTGAWKIIEETTQSYR